jgi:hypothetical protein
MPSSHPSRRNHSNYTWWRVQITKILRMLFSPPSHHFNPYGLIILLSTLFTNTLRLCSSPNVRDKDSQPYRTTGKIIVNCYVFRQQTRRQNVLDWMAASIAEFNLLLISWIKFWFVTVIPKYTNCDMFPTDLFAIFMSRFWPAFWWQENNIYLVFSASISGPTSLPSIIKASVFQHKPEADVPHSISVPPGFPGPS